MKVIVIPEDFRNDQYVLKPIIKAMFQNLQIPSVTVRVCQDPALGGVAQALNFDRIDEIVNRYKGMTDVFLLCIDRDGIPGRRDRLDQIEKHAAASLKSDQFFFAENAWQEIEVWALAGHELPAEWTWRTIREEIHPKEKYFIPFSKKKNLFDEPGEGRKTLAIEAAGKYKRIKQLCPEDIGNLEAKLQKSLNAI